MVLWSRRGDPLRAAAWSEEGAVDGPLRKRTWRWNMLDPVKTESYLAIGVSVLITLEALGMIVFAVISLLG